MKHELLFLPTDYTGNRPSIDNAVSSNLLVVYIPEKTGITKQRYFTMYLFVFCFSVLIFIDSIKIAEFAVEDFFDVSISKFPSQQTVISYFKRWEINFVSAHIKHPLTGERKKYPPL